MNNEITNIPQHIAIIMDGNGRWAMERGHNRSLGHAAGFNTVRNITSECTRLGVKYLTLYTFSTENWNRPVEEVTALMGLVLDSMEEELFMKNGVRFRVIGDMSRVPAPVLKRLNDYEELTRNNTKMTMVVALSYSSRWEITEAARQIAQEVKEGKLALEDINDEVMSQHMATNFMPDPDLLIRTGGEIRVSNYLLWQIAYSEMYFCDTYWPDFDEECLHKAIACYQGKQRRYGKTEAQIEEEQKNANKN